jgi:hypothetical protein
MEQEIIQRKKPSLFGMIFSPGEQFERLREKPVIWIPLILFTVLMTVVAAISALNADYSAVPGMEMSPEELEMAKTFGIAGAAVVGFFVTPITYLIIALIFWGISKIAKSDATFKQMLSFTIFSSFITIIGQIFNLLITMAIDGDPFIMLTSVNSFVGADGILGAVLSTIEVFTIWYYILLTMGLVIVGKLSKPAATIITIVFFILQLLFAAIGGAFEGMTQL